MENNPNKIGRQTVTKSTRRRILQLSGLGLFGLTSGCLRLQQSDGGEEPTERPTPTETPASATATNIPTAADTATQEDTPTETPEGDDSLENIRAAYVYTGTTEGSWTQSHDQARQSIEAQFDWLETETAQSVSPEEAENVFRQFAESGYDIIFGTTLPFMDPMATVASEFPDTYFENCTGYRTRPNMGRYFGRIYQARYLSGIAAGMLTETDTLGFVAAFPITEVIRGINSFALGAASVNDGVTVKVEFTDAWYDPSTVASLTEQLIDDGADVIAHHQDSSTAVETANDADVWAIGYHLSMSEAGGDNYVTSSVWHWDAFYEPTIQSVRTGGWEADAYWEGLSSGVVDLSEWGPEVTENIKEEVTDVRSQIESGDLDVWSESRFSGESDEFLFREMESFVDPVEGQVSN